MRKHEGVGLLGEAAAIDALVKSYRFCVAESHAPT
jgi:hypothetical protein